MARLLKLSNYDPGKNWIGDHLGSMHFVFFQFGYDWQKYYETLPNFTN